MLALALVTLLATPSLDTTIAVQRGQRLEISAQTGTISVHAWARNAVRIQATGDNLSRIGIDQSPSVLGIRGIATRGAPGSISFDVSAPAWMAVRLSGVNTKMRVSGTDAAVTVETLNGDVEVSGGNGVVSLRSVQGAVTLIGAKGKLDLNSVNSEVRVQDVAGELQAETVNGEIRLEKVQSDNVEASTVNGDVDYDGTIRPSGRYRFATHNGDVAVTVAEGTSAVVAVSTFQGDFESSFPVTLTEHRGKRFEFTLGGGSARIDLESFGGTIRLVRPGERPSPRGHDRDSARDHDPDD